MTAVTEGDRVRARSILRRLGLHANTSTTAWVAEAVAEARSEPRILLSEGSSAVLLCAFRTCPWQSEDVRTLSVEQQDGAIRDHLLGDHRDQLDALALLTDAQP